jgi:ubiquinone/menaquinone biosynthesis C-methylase UbiE
MMIADPREMVKYISVMPNMKVADFGAGAGAYSSILLDRIGEEGQVYALDALPQSLETVRRQAQKAGKRCMTLCTEFENELPMRSNLIDVAILANTLHAVDPTRRQDFIHELERVLVPNGQVLVLDWAGSFDNMGPPAPMVVTPVDAVRLFRAAGFSTSTMLPAGTHHYAFVARGPARQHTT